MTHSLQSVPASSGRIYTPVHSEEYGDTPSIAGGHPGFALLAIVLSLVCLVGFVLMPSGPRLILAVALAFLLPLIALKVGNRVIRS